MLRRLVPLVVLVAGVAVAAWIALVNWRAAGEVALPWQGWLALGLGAFVTIALGAGLMALIFYSNRRGYDDRAAERPPPPPEDEDED